MREHEVLCIGGLCDGRRAAPLYGRSINFTAEAAIWAENNTDARRPCPAFEYQIHEIKVEGGKVLRIGVPKGFNPADTLELLMDSYPAAKRS